jgi:hypothetical protein
MVADGSCLTNLITTVFVSINQAIYTIYELILFRNKLETRENKSVK